MKIMGLDIGGANTDCSIIEIDENNNIVSMKNDRTYFPMWKNNHQLNTCLKNFIKNDEDVEVVCISMTAELADGYTSKKEGVLDISSTAIKIFHDKEVYFVTFDGLKTFEELKENLLSAAAANWIGTSEIIKHIGQDCIFMDIGSTTTDIIPVSRKGEIAQGHSDLERLATGELVYTGMLRTNLAAIVQEVPIYNKITKVSSEYFSITADIHRILGNIEEKDYTCETPDSNKKDIISCKRRLARLVCADLDTLDDKEIINLANYIQEQQINQIYEGLKKVVKSSDLKTVLIMSIGKGDLCEIAAKKLNLKVISLDNYISKKASNVLTAIGAVQMYLDKKNNSLSLIEKI